MNEVTKTDRETLPTIVEQKEVMSLIERALTDPAISVEKLNGLYDFQQRIAAQAAKIEAEAAYFRVCSAMPRIKKNGMIDYNKPGVKPIPYAKWEDIMTHIKPIYEAENFNLTFDNEIREGGGLTKIAKLTHANGHCFMSKFSVPLDTSGGKQNVQGMGSSDSFASRYSVRNLFNLVFEGEDDDGVKGGQVFITLEQMKQINTLLAETKTDVPQFLRMFEVVEVENLTKANFAPALNMLLAKKAKMK